MDENDAKPINVDREDFWFKVALTTWAVDLAASLILLGLGVMTAGFIMLFAALGIALIAVWGVVFYALG